MASHAEQLRDAALAVINNNGGWMPADAIFKRIEMVCAKQQLVAALDQLFRSGAVQRIVGGDTLEYGPAGVAKPVYEPALADGAIARAGRPPERGTYTDQILQALHEAGPAGLMPKDLYEITPSASALLNQLGRQGRAGKHRTQPTRWVSARYITAQTEQEEPEQLVEPALSVRTSAPAAPAAIPEPMEAAPVSAPPTARSSTSQPRFALWSTGELVIERGIDNVTVLVAEETRALFKWLDTIRGMEPAL